MNRNELRFRPIKSLNRKEEDYLRKQASKLRSATTDIHAAQFSDDLVTSFGRMRYLNRKAKDLTEFHV